LIRTGDRDAAFDRLATLITSSPHNLVARGERARIRDVHIPECAAVGEALAVAPETRWLDLGTGGGLPGLVLAILEPRVSWTLLDATGKKVQAVRSFIEALELPNAQAVHGRAEEVQQDPAHRGAYDGVIARAVARLPILLELARGFLRDDGLLAAIKGPRVDEEIRAAERVRQLLRFDVFHSQTVAGTARPTTLVTMRVQGPLPQRRTRRPDIPAATRRGGRPR
jgi:16S rRNA (guanine527-N7)-methyltransferase